MYSNFAPLECFALGQNTQVQDKLQIADSEVSQAFTYISQAENAGANVTILISQLNNAIKILDEAQNLYNSGDANAASKADIALHIAQETTNSAKDLEKSALISQRDAYWSTAAFTIFGVLIFLLIIFLAWKIFKRNYIKNLKIAKPQAIIR